jgi:arylsulfatase
VPAGTNPILFAKFYDLYRDPREERPIDSIKYGTWAGGQFGAMVERHMKHRQKFPDRELARDEPYGGIQNLRPETVQLLENYKRIN